jgi:glutathione S-transferase
MEPLTFYTNPMSRGRIAHWMLEEVGQPYQTVWLDYGTTMKAQPYLSVNPMGKVPALTHGDHLITENAAIITWLADAFPQAGLFPADRGRFYRWMFFGAGPLEAAVTNAALGVQVPPDRRGMVGYGSLGQVTDVLDQALTQAPYLCGAAFSAADVFVGSQIGWGMQFKTIEPRPALVDYWSRISARPALARSSATCDARLKKE